MFCFSFDLVNLSMEVSIIEEEVSYNLLYQIITSAHVFSERFLVPLTRYGLPENRERLNDISTVFTVRITITHSTPP